MKQVVERNQDTYNCLIQTPLSEMRGSEALEQGATSDEKTRLRNDRLHAFIEYAKSLVDGGYWDKFNFVLAAYTAEIFFPLTSTWFYSPVTIASSEDVVKYVLTNPRPMFEKLAENELFKSIIATKSIDDLVKQFKREALTCFWTNAQANEETLWADFKLTQLFSTPSGVGWDVQNTILVSKTASSVFSKADTFTRHPQALAMHNPTSRRPFSLKQPSPGGTYCATVFDWMGSPNPGLLVGNETKEGDTSISLDGKTICPRQDIRGHIARSLVFLSDKYPEHTNDLTRFVKYDTLLNWVAETATLRDVFWQMVLVYIQRDIDPRMFVSPQIRRTSATRNLVGVSHTSEPVPSAKNPLSLAADQAYEHEPNPVAVLYHTDIREFRVRERVGSQASYRSVVKGETVDQRYLAAIKQYEKDLKRLV
jgi:hypothetical protein